jgi:hypothetical protein
MSVVPNPLLYFNRAEAQKSWGRGFESRTSPSPTVDSPAARPDIQGRSFPSDTPGPFSQLAAAEGDCSRAFVEELVLYPAQGLTHATIVQTGPKIVRRWRLQARHL